MFNKFSDPLSFLETDGSFTPIKTTPVTPAGKIKTTTTSPSAKYGTDAGLNSTTTTTPTTSQPTKAVPSGSSLNPTKTMDLKEFVSMGFNRDDFMHENKHEMSDIFRKVIVEYMDYTDIETNRRLMALDEEEQNTLLLSLTKKFYGMIIGKVDEVDFGEIPSTKGDITKLSKYKELIQCLELMKGIFEQYRENTEPVKVINTAIDNVIMNRDLFVSSYVNKIELGIYMYNTITLSIINALSYMISVCIEYVKDPKKEGLKIVMDKTGIGKVKDHLVYENLIKFNDACRKGDVENSLRPLVRSKAKNFVTAALFSFKSVLVLGGVLLAILPLIRDLVYFFFATKARVSTYFDVQATLLEMNAQEIKDGSAQSEEDKQKVIRRQLRIAGLFRKLSDFLAVEAKQSERKATNDIKEDSKSYKIDEVETNPAPSDGSPDGPLF